MNKLIYFVIAIIILMIPLTVSADYATFYDVINDVKLLLDNDFDKTWKMNFSASNNTSNLEGFSCIELENQVICRKKDWSGEYQISMILSNETVASVECMFTSPSLQDLNYQPGSGSVYVVDDLLNRLKSYGMLPENAIQLSGFNLFESTSIFPYGAAFEISSNTLLQAGYKSKSETDPLFRMGFIVRPKHVEEQVLQQETVNSEKTNPSDPAELCDLAFHYYLGMNVPQDFEKAIELYQSAADQGYAEAQYALGWVYYKGKGVDHNDENAKKWLQMAADQGYEKARLFLDMYEENSLPDYTDAEAQLEQYIKFWKANENEGIADDWCLSAAELGNIRAQVWVALLNSENIPNYEAAVYWAQKAADQGSLKSQYELGVFYHDGTGVEQNDELAVYWWKKASENDVSNFGPYSEEQFTINEAQNRLGWSYYKGEGVERNDETAKYWFRKAAENGDEKAEAFLDLYKTNNVPLYNDAVAHYNRYLDYINGTNGVKQSVKKGNDWYRSAAELGHPEAEYYRAYDYVGNIVERENYERYFYWMSKAGEQGITKAQQIMADYYFGNGSGTSYDYLGQDFEQAAYWYDMLAKKGDQNAQINLAKCYLELNDSEQAIFWLNDAAAKGNQNAQYELGVLYYEGLYIPQNPEMAINWLKRSAENGNLKAQYQLGMVYYENKGVAQNLELSKHWLSRAADKNYPDAIDSLARIFPKTAPVDPEEQYRLGMKYILPMDYEKAFYWFQKAAEQGYADAQYEVGNFYYRGLGVEKNIEEARYWLEKAAEQGNKDAKKLLKNF